MSDSSTSNSSSDSDKDQTPLPVLDLLQISIEAGQTVLGNATLKKIPCQDSGLQGAAYIQEVNPVPYGTKRGRGFGYLPDFKHESKVGKPTSKSVAKRTLLIKKQNSEDFLLIS
ncbi:hypothetical protein CROQUDRAFT_90460 [Cronartium quercuum f. sp. fusiforme G11]|uniref:Uncharacterized protein n=1 Tax=Cronartium quercuum f. sp. fusiforme G11 TaxID=708437 RepID=A0A9P6NRP0_9BASI|nr:hypothetical protein CROQUDRAFT_90460 [Cronartium quercuum f. sp. fusiforme G11]